MAWYEVRDETMKLPLPIRYFVDTVLGRYLWQPQYPSVHGVPVRYLSYSSYRDMIAKGCRYEQAKPPARVPRGVMKIVSSSKSDWGLIGATVRGYTIDGNGHVLSLRLDFDDGEIAEITADVV